MLDRRRAKDEGRWKGLAGVPVRDRVRGQRPPARDSGRSHADFRNRAVGDWGTLSSEGETWRPFPFFTTLAGGNPAVARDRGERTDSARRKPRPRQFRANGLHVY